MDEWTSSDIAGIVTVVASVGQAIAAPWRDLGVLTLAAAGATLTLARGAPTPFAAGMVLLALVLAASSWGRGARRGIGRPGLDGIGFALAAIGGLWTFVLTDPHVITPIWKERIVDALLVAQGLAASVGFTLALERPGPRRLRPRFFRRVEVVEQPPEARGEPAS